MVIALHLVAAIGDMGSIYSPSKQMLYVVGVSFTAELTAKVAYEETMGRLFVGIQGTELSAAGRLLARQVADYATFLQQAPWYRWDFDVARAELAALPAATANARSLWVRNTGSRRFTPAPSAPLPPGTTCCA